ncbi:hypothetical protein J7E97_01000 [Streptomyces sp. ISL-66]|uniref:WXG100 family type VII secretion target n=1 Tax=Streptomyces sp. ISL-66 TaxID=2819186 RepID=UPI001BE4F90E|nr:hypothetical protein [Streptomyces sp. ISL-66]MBT2466474.1 hypothetical protein [Streptomyces sp. ISL-66]
MARTDFEGHTHQQLLAMLASANADTLKTRGAQLTDAAAVIKEIGESLKEHRVTGWEGESSQAFQEWVSQTGNATLRLSEYSAAGGKQMTQASQVVIEVKANMPSYDAGAAANLKAAREFHNDPDSQQVGQEATSKLNGDHQQAVQQMTKLAQGYEASATGMESAEIPTFPKLPPTFVPPKLDDGGQAVTRPGGDSTGTGGTRGTYAPVAGAPSGSSYAPDSTSGPQPGPVGISTGTTSPTPGPISVLPDRNVGTDLNTVGTLPDRTLPPTTGVPGGVNPSGPGGAVTGVTPGGFIPPMTVPPVGGMSRPGSGIGPGSLAHGVPGMSGPGGKAGGLGGIAGLPPRDSGIVGGRPVTSGGPSAGIPRGTVIGGEGGAQTTGRGMGGMGAGAGGAHGGVGGSMAGRRLAMEPGGAVGGRQAGAGGRSVAGGQPFTQGGSGLVRNGSGAGSTARPMGHGGAGAHAPGLRGAGQSGERPDYLAEDEETWQGGRSVVPPVID